MTVTITEFGEQRLYRYPLADFPNELWDHGTLLSEVTAATGAPRIIGPGLSGACEILYGAAITEATLAAVIAAHTGAPAELWEHVTTTTALTSADLSATEVVSNGGPAIEIAAGFEGYAATSLTWPRESTSYVRVTVPFVLKAAGTGTTVSIGVKVKSKTIGDDAASAFTPHGGADVTVVHDTIGTVYSAVVTLDGSGIGHEDITTIQVGRDGDAESDTCTSTIQILGLGIEAR